MENFVAHIEKEKNGIKEQMVLKYPERNIQAAFESLKQRGFEKEDIKCVHVAGFKLAIPVSGKKTVLFKKWIPQQWVDKEGNVFDRRENTSLTQKPGTGKYDDNYIHVGIFHRWAEETHEQDNGVYCQETYAIVELPNGTIEAVIPTKIQFT